MSPPPPFPPPGGCRTSVNSSTLTRQRLDYKWQQTATIDAASHVTSLSWNLEGTRLLTAGEVIQMWFCPDLEQQQQQPHSTSTTNNNNGRSVGAGAGQDGQDDGPKSSVVFTIGGAPGSTTSAVPPPNTAPPALNGHASVRLFRELV